jgi:hypothetical protein
MAKRKPRWLIEKEQSVGSRIQPWQIALWVAAAAVGVLSAVALAMLM